MTDTNVKRESASSDIPSKQIVVWKDGTWLLVESGVTYEYETDPDWLVTIPVPQ